MGERALTAAIMGAAIGIAKARVVEVTAGMARPLWTARGAIEARRGLLIKVEDASGNWGQGECSPLPGYSPDSLADCHHALVDFPWREVTLDPAREITAQIASVLERVGERLPAARFAVETALLDLVGRRLGVPAHAILLGGRAATPVALSALLAGDSDAARISEAQAAIARGARTLKWKIGRPGGFDHELDFLLALRRAVGPDISLRLDANGAFSLEEAAVRLSALAAVAPALIEEPVADRLDELVPMALPVAADESLRGAHGWERVARAIQARACSAVALKPTVLGGSLACLAIARLAAALGAGAFVTHCFDGPVALAATAALALALPEPRLPAGLDRHAALAGWPEVPLPMIGAHQVRPWTAPGLGLPPLGAR